MSVRGDHAVVIGGSMAGLFTARALHEHFVRVTVLDRDPLVAGLPAKGAGGQHLMEFASQRRGTPQAFHVHALIYGSRLCLDDLYGGGFTDAMLAAGASYLDMAREHAILTPGGWILRHPGELMSVYATRYTTEGVVRGLTAALPTVELRQGLVTGLLASADDSVVTGVVYQSDDGGGTLEADLVVDASGRGSRAPAWIERLGYQPPEESLVHSHLGYATVYCRVPDGAWPGDIRSLTATPVPGTTRGVSFNPQEDGLYGLIAVGQNRDYPPDDREGFTEFLRTAVCPLPYEIFRESEQLTDIRTTRTSANRLRHWHELTRLPGGFVALGDAAAAFNPTYGQGICTAAYNARTLRDRLREHDDVTAAGAGIHTELINSSQLAWFIATQSDLAFEATESRGVAPAPAETERFFRRLRQVATRDPIVAHAFLKAIMSLDAAQLGDPDVIARVTGHQEIPEPTLAEMARPPAWADTTSLSTNGASTDNLDREAIAS
jgi:2-polyprenyl-6-methoxyphenol hydroxylase-like FAD-dependent oxidoreductase